MALYENTVVPERAVLLSVDTGAFDAEASMEELQELARSAGAQVLATVIQKRPAPDGATCIGEGKLQEIRDYCKANKADLAVFDCELSPVQIRNLERELEVRVIDRTTLILDIFASRARSKEGALQVELAQLKYLLPRLAGKGTALSRLGGGIGTRGPGESKLESDRRHIRRRIESLEDQLRQVERRRGQLRRRRKKDGIASVAIVGYTNAGKSTLMNALTQAGVLAEDKLFATLDPTARALKLPHGQTVMLIDTVGLVRRLPHHLVEAFHSTLEEAAQADVILNVCDASSEEAAIHLKTTGELLESLGCEGIPVIPVMNKCDKPESGGDLPAIGGTVRISAKTGMGLDRLLAAIEKELPEKRRVTMLFPFAKAGLAAQIRSSALLLEEEYTGQGVRVTALLNPIQYQQYKEYLAESVSPESKEP